MTVANRSRRLAIPRSAPFAAAALVLSLASGCGESELARSLTLVQSASPQSPTRPAHRGLRAVESKLDGTVRVHTEQIFDDGIDDLGAKLVKVGDAPASDAQQLWFVKDARALFSYRDLALDGVDRVLRNYAIEKLPDTTPVAGRPTVHFLFKSRHDAGLVLDVRCDQASGLTLELERKTLAGLRLYRLVYESVEIGAITRVESDPPTLPYPPKTIDAAHPPFSPLSTSWAPAGYELASHSFGELKASGETYSACVDRFTDGLEHFFVVQGSPSKGLWVSPPAAMPDGQLRFFTSSMGAITIVWGEPSGRSFAAYGALGDKVLAEAIARYAN